MPYSARPNSFMRLRISAVTSEKVRVLGITVAPMLVRVCLGGAGNGAPDYRENGRFAAFQSGQPSETAALFRPARGRGRRQAGTASPTRPARPGQRRRR